MVRPSDGCWMVLEVSGHELRSPESVIDWLNFMSDGPWRSLGCPQISGTKLSRSSYIKPLSATATVHVINTRG